MSVVEKFLTLSRFRPLESCGLLASLARLNGGLAIEGFFSVVLEGIVPDKTKI